jgi:hypothetical protein
VKNKKGSTDESVRDYYYEYFKASMKRKDAPISTKTEGIKNVIFAKAPEEIKARKRHSEPVSTSPAVKKSRPAEETKKSLLKKYPGLSKF